MSGASSLHVGLVLWRRTRDGRITLESCGRYHQEGPAIRPTKSDAFAESMAPQVKQLSTGQRAAGIG